MNDGINDYEVKINTAETWLVVIAVMGRLIFWWIVGIIGVFTVTFHTPVETDFVERSYKMAAADGAAEFITEMQKDNWENRGLTALTKDDRSWIIAEVRKMFNGNYWSGYEGEKVARIADPQRDIAYVDSMVSYEGNHVYRVKENLPINFFAIGDDGKCWNRYARVEYEYIVTVKCNPERKWYGLMAMNWELLDTEIRRISDDEDEIMTLTENTPIPTPINYEEEEYKEKMKHQPEL